jgi:predicted GH43/DUF377 family glycosyl hydrolase
MIGIILILAPAGIQAQTEWEKYTGNPVLSGGSQGEWDESGVIGTRILFDGTTYHMWYSTLDSLGGLGYATSSDGINWTKYNANPVLEPGPEGTWDDTVPGSPSVILANSIYHMWYFVFDGTIALIGYATSPDGTTWTKHASNPVLSGGSPGTWDDAGVLDPEVILKDSTYHMWYTGWDGTNTRIGHATSSDGVNWTKSAGNPVLDIGPIESWDAAMVGYSSVVSNGITYKMWYTGNDSMEVGTPWGANIYGIGYATSTDGIAWTKFEENSVLSRGVWGAWDALVAFLPDVIFDGIKYQMWYTGLDIPGGDLELNIGYAVSPDLVITSISDVPEDKDGLPITYVLNSAYPNPFNPVSTIRYELPHASDVSLIVYNILGREMVRLVNGYMEPGYHEVHWNGQEFPSGVYIARLVTSEYTKSIKMLLLK